jgi:hypothetical protein
MCAPGYIPGTKKVGDDQGGFAYEGPQVPEQPPETRSPEQVAQAGRNRRLVDLARLRRLTGLRSTMLTGGAGVTGAPQTAQKTLLGL